MTKSTQYKIAILHDWLIQFGGAEKTLEAMLEVFPEAYIYTAKFDKKILAASDILRRSYEKNKIIYPKQNFISKLSNYLFMFLIASVFENFDMSGYDIVISEGTAWPKGVITKPEQLHISYVHTPPRFLYGYNTESNKRDKWYFKLMFSYIDNILRLWDFIAAQRPDYLLTNSEETRRRIQKFYRREATVINPPVEVNFINSNNTPKELHGKKYYVILGRLSRYKNFDKVIKAFNMTNYTLAVIGTGSEERYLKSISSSNIQFLGRVTDAQKHDILSNALGVINAVEDEDFGIVPIEAMAHGKPVLAYKAGGHLETIEEGVNGMFFDNLSTDYMIRRIEEFHTNIINAKFNEDTIKKTSLKYDKEIFKSKLMAFVDKAYEDNKYQTTELPQS